MKRATVFIIEKDGPVANLIRYQLLSHSARHVQVFPTQDECMYFMHKKSIPDFLITDLNSSETDAADFLKGVLHSFPGVKIIFLSGNTDSSLVNNLMAEGATDYIYKSDRKEVWIHELIKNVDFLVREKTRVNL